MTGAISSEQCAAVIVAGGAGSRAGLATPKQYAPYRGTTVLGMAVAAMRQAVGGPVVIVVPAGDETVARRAIGAQEVLWAVGGATRQQSVRAGLEKLVDVAPQAVAIHDAARPDLPGAVMARLLAALDKAPGAIPVLPVADSMVTADGTAMGEPVRRETLRRVQTPQVFDFRAILAAHRAWQGEPNAGDDAQVLRAAGHAVALVDGDSRLHKLTFAEDFEMDAASGRAALRIGSGYDVHRLVPGDGVWLCGVRIAHDRALAGHSDADVALHALTDAVLGAVAAGDIGDHFPPSEPRWRGAASHLFLTRALEIAAESGYVLGNADLTIVCERPRIGPHRDAMRAALAGIAGVDTTAISVKATTSERLGFTGRGEGIAAQAVVTMLAQTKG